MITVINAKTISDAWFQCLYNLFDKGYKQEIQKGSFEKEQYRIQYPSVAIEIEYPWLDIVPVIPAGLGIPSPTTQEYIEDYFANYLMDSELAENETYKYASRIHEEVWSGNEEDEDGLEFRSYTQLDKVVDMLKKTPLTNQACLEIAKPSDIVTCVGNDNKLDPPCLRLIDFKVIPKFSTCVTCSGTGVTPVYKGEYSITMSVYFRSWDLWAGLPTNLGGLELLKQYVADECGLVNGKMYAYSAGLHIYGYQEEIARIRTMKNR